jgi:Tfp pilus assembly protein PilO
MKNVDLKGVNATRIKMVVAIIVLVGGMYSFYTFLLSPLITEKATLTTDITTLESQVKDVTALGKQLEDAKTSVLEKEIEVVKMKESPKYKSVSYINFINSVGVLQEKTGVELVSIVEEDFISRDSYWEIPYSMVIAGSYDEIISFINGIYQSGRFHVITNVQFHTDSSVLTSSKNLVLANAWATDIKSVIDGVYPPDPNKPKATTKPDGTPVTPEGTAPTATTTPVETVPTENGITKKEEEVLHLDFSFKFISIEDPSSVK